MNVVAGPINGKENENRWYSGEIENILNHIMDKSMETGKVWGVWTDSFCGELIYVVNSVGVFAQKGIWE